MWQFRLPLDSQDDGKRSRVGFLILVRYAAEIANSRLLEPSRRSRLLRNQPSMFSAITAGSGRPVLSASQVLPGLLEPVFRAGRFVCTFEGGGGRIANGTAHDAAQDGIGCRHNC